jgi:hypothetical protein
LVSVVISDREHLFSVDSLALDDDARERCASAIHDLAAHWRSSSREHDQLRI